jgi:hypothetical protein
VARSARGTNCDWNIKARFPIGFNTKLVVACLVGVIPSLVFPSNNLWGVAITAFIYYIIIIVGLYLIKPFSTADIRFLRHINPFLARALGHFAKNLNCDGKLREY